MHVLEIRLHMISKNIILQTRSYLTKGFFSTFETVILNLLHCIVLKNSTEILQLLWLQKTTP